MRRLGALGGMITTLIVGVLFGYVASTFVNGMSEGNPWFGGGEPPEARSYLLGLLQNNPDALVRLRPGQGIVERAEQQLIARESRALIVPQSLTYMGGRSAGGMTVAAYAFEIEDSFGRLLFYPLVVTLFDGKVVRTQ